MKVLSTYQPVQEGIVRVEETLRSIKEVDSPSLARVLEHILKGAGKRIRPALTLLAGKFHHYNLDLLIPMAAGVELLHTATLVHDDTIDRAAVRRGIPTLNIAWSGGIAVLVGDYLFAKSAELVSSTGNLRVTSLFAQTLVAICSGELEQDFCAYDWTKNRQHYFRRIGNKTASLFSAATESGAILSDAPEEAIQALKSYGYNLGVAFQIVDDILDFTGEEQEVGKPLGSDLLQGTLTLPAILLLERYPQDNPIKEISQDKSEQQSLKRAIEMIRNSSIIPESYSVAQDFCSKACQNLEKLPDNVSRRSLLELAGFVVERKR